MRLRLAFVLSLISCATLPRNPTAPAQNSDDILSLREEELAEPLLLTSQGLEQRCAAAATKCAAIEPPWFGSEVCGDELVVKPSASGSRIEAVKRWASNRTGVSRYRRCHAAALRGAAVPDLEVETEVRATCPFGLEAPTVFDDAVAFEAALLRCAEHERPLEVTVNFLVANETSTLRSESFVFDDAVGLDGPLRACLTKALTRTVELEPGAAPRWKYVRVKLRARRDGSLRQWAASPVWNAGEPPGW